ncbi:MAG: DbpA RNA binding domain-containing protein, partial [Clostridia bacterium]|nr:DbpA RNA binding domain-containing protein [Clostridia bacterium]
GETGLPGRSIGRIEIADRYTTFDVPAEAVQTVIEALNRTKIMGRRVTARVFTVTEQY